MNKQRRKELAEVFVVLEGARDALESLKDEEQCYYDNMPESIQEGQRGEAADEAIDAMDDAITSLEDAVRSIGEAIGEE